MPPRYKERCRFCPDPAPQPALQPSPQTQNMMLAITSPGEGARLWKHVLFGTSTCVQMIEGYSALDMPGNPSEALVALRDRIDKVLSKYEEPHDANDTGRSPEEHKTPPDENPGEASAGRIGDGS